MTDQLHLANDFALPLDAVTETFAILAKRGKGKTNTAVVMAEEMIGASLPVVVIDPVGVWWGIRSSADGQSAGLPVVVFGGDHADVPLEPTAGTVIADVLVDQRFPAIIDVSSLSKSAARRFMADFIERLYHRNRDALHVIVDEADAFAPQRAQADGLRLLGAMEDLVRRGRARGIGVTLITQRPAVLHKDVLTQAEVLVALGMTGPRDVAAIDEWVRLHADEDQAREVKASLPALPVGTAWVWSPGWLDVLQRVQIRARRTFDSSATPKAGERRATPAAAAEVDLAALGEQIAATVEKARADDPAALRARIRQLEKDLAAERAKPATPAEPQVVEVPAIADDDLASIGDRLDALMAVLPELTGAVQGLRSVHDRRPARPPQVAATGKRGPMPPASELLAAKPPAPPTGSAESLTRAERRILTALAQHGTRTTVQVAMITGYSAKSGGYRNALSSLRSAGRIDGRGDITITADGISALGTYDPLPTGSDLLDWWKHHQLSKAERAIVDVLADHDGGPVDTATIADLTGYSASSGGFRNACSRLRTLEVATGRGDLTLNPELL